MFNQLHGVRIQVIHDHKVYRHEIVKAKRRQSGPKFQRIKIHTGWSNFMKDGQAVHSKEHDVFMMNPRTKRDLDLAMKAQQHTNLM